MLSHKKLFDHTCTLSSFSISCKRRSRIKKAERIENQKKIVITGDQKLSRILSKHSKYMNFQEAVLAKNYHAKEHEIEMAITSINGPVSWRR